jgi:adenosylcobinamide-GDP ribazoletransferase
VAAIPLVLLGASLPVAAAVLAVMVLAAISGGLHLDGLSDTADALAAPSPDAAARARSDPRAGPAGVAWVVLVLLLDVSLLAAIAAVDVVLAVAGLVAASASSRAAPVVAAWLAGRSRARAAGSLGTWFSDRVHARDLVFALVTAAAAIALCAAAARDLRMITGAVVGIGVAGAASIAVVLRRGQLDGDGFGAIVELTFASIVAGVAVAAVGP